MRRAEPAKCTMLPALASIDPLLGEDVFAFDVEKPVEKEARTPARNDAQKLKPPIENENFGATARRTFHTQREGSSLSAASPDEEFQEWVRHTQPSFRNSGSDPRKSPSIQATESVSAPMKKTKIAEECFLLLLRNTFEAPANTKEHVHQSLVSTLGLDTMSAEWKVDAAIKRPYVNLATFEDKREAFRVMEALMDFGLHVRVSMTGTLDEGVASGQGMKKDYVDTFNSRKSGRKSTLRRLPPVLPGGRTLGGFAWRNQHSKMSILPEDPVNHLFETEQRQEEMEKAATDEKAREDEAPELAEAPEPLPPKQEAETPAPDDVSPSQRGILKGLVKKHRGTIKVASSMASRRSKLGMNNLIMDMLDAKNENAAEPKMPTGAPTATSTAAKWDCVLDAMTAGQKISQDRKEACQMLRFFVYGKVGNENASTARERDRIYYEGIGTKHEVFQLFGMWRKLDDDNSGRVDITEFRAFAENNMKQMIGMDLAAGVEESFGTQGTAEENVKFISKLCDKLAQLLLGKKSSFVIEDMMRLIWPCSQISDIKQMKQWCKELASQGERHRVRTPPVMSADEREALISVFQHFDDDGSGTVGIEELLSKGLIYQDQADSYLLDWDRDRDGQLSLSEFLEMMCPAGFRAEEKSEIGTLPSGTRIFWDQRTALWREEGEDYHHC